MKVHVMILTSVVSYVLLFSLVFIFYHSVYILQLLRYGNKCSQ